MKTKITTLFFAILFAQSVSAQWTAVNKGLPIKEFSGLGIISDTLFTAIKGSGVYYSADNGDTWNAWKYNSNLRNYNFNSFDAQGPSMVILGDSLWAYYEQNNGMYDLPISGIPLSQSNSSWLKDENPSTNFMGTDDGVFYSGNGVSWTASTGIPTSDSINDFGFLEYTDSEEYISVATDNGIYRSMDNGVSFSVFQAGLPSGLRVNELGLLTLTENGLYLFNADNQVFTQVKDGGDYLTTYVDFNTFNAYCFGDNIGTIFSLVNASTQNITLTGITGGNIIGTTLMGDYLFVCTQNGGVFRKSLSGNVGVQSVNSVNSVNVSVSPNPSNGNFLISVNTPEIIDLIDAKGVLIHSYFVQSKLNISENLASGLYFIQERGSKKTQKIIIE